MLPLHQKAESLKDHPPESQGIFAQITRFVRLRTLLFRRQTIASVAVVLLMLYVLSWSLSSASIKEAEVPPKANIKPVEKIEQHVKVKPTSVPKIDIQEEPKIELDDDMMEKKERDQTHPNAKQQQAAKDDELDEETKMRREAVHQAFMHAWKAYRDHAFGQDELDPISCSSAGSWMNMGLTLVDSLDVLWLMDEKEEFKKARDWVEQSLGFDQNRFVSFFETIIRILGGLLSAYDLSGDRIFVQKATQLADRLLFAFNTSTGIPHASINLHNHAGHSPSWTGGSSILAEISSVQLEFNYLSKVTGNPEYAERALKVFDILEKTNPSDGLYPIYISSSTGRYTTGLVTLGAMGDSFYEYELKLYYQTGDEKYLNMYRKSAAGIMKHLVQKTTPNGLTYLCDMDRGSKQHKMDHLACFAGGMFALGAKEFADADKHMDVAKGITATCHEMYARQTTGVAPEYIRITGNDFVNGANHNLLRPETVEAYFVLWRLTHDKKYRDWGWDAFQAFEKYAKTSCGYAGIRDVTSTYPSHDNKMQSFYLAETLKYLYLLYSPDSLIPLDQYVFNTEAHPIRVFSLL